MVDLFILDTQVEQSDIDAEEAAGSLCLGRFSRGAAPVALLALTTGGMHCCFTIRAVPSDGGDVVDRDFGNYPPWFRETASWRRFSSAPTTRSPISSDRSPVPGRRLQLFGWSGTAFIDVTRKHLDLVADDAQNLPRACSTTRPQPEKLGFLAGYLADECVLGAATSTWSFIDQQRQLGPLVDRPTRSGALAVAGYEPALRQFVIAQGYCPDDLGETASQISFPGRVA